ncbi:MAG: TolC family protein [Erythrobacter sp.]|nr:TolC family protein [Erythrobacter sp.]
MPPEPTATQDVRETPAAPNGPATDPMDNPGPPADPSGAALSIPSPLSDAVEIALAQNPSVLAQLAELAALNSDLEVAQWQRFPNLSAEVLATTGGSNAADADGLAVNLALEQPIWAGGGIGARIDAARINRDVGRTAIREVRFNILNAVISAYYEALLSFERARVIEAGLVEMRALVVSIERRVAQQVSPLADLTLAQSRLTQLEIELSSANQQGENALVRLEQLVGAPVENVIFPAAGLTDNLPPEALALMEMVNCSPALERRQGEVDLAEAQVDTVRSDILPQVLLQLSQSELTGSRAALVLRMQTGNGLSNFAATDSARARVDRAIAELGEADREVRAQLRSQYVDLRSNQRRDETGTIAVDAADSLLLSYERQFVAGRRSWLDVLNAAREKVSTRIALSDARVSVANSATRILALSCRWRPEGI